MPTLLYFGDLGVGQTSADRANALERLGATVQRVPVLPPERSFAARLDGILARRYQRGNWVSRVNGHLLDSVSGDYDIVWIDKGWMLWPETVAQLKKRARYVVLFNNDNPWGPLEASRWRLLHGSLKHFDLVITPRNASVPNYLAAGVRKVRVCDFSFDRERQVPPPADEAGGYAYPVSFVGTATPDGAGVRPDRAQFLSQIAARMPGRLAIFGSGWNKHAGNLKDARSVQPGQYGAGYNKIIWSSECSLSFVNWAQADETSHRAYEITACRGLLVAERSPGLEASFDENTEALFFTGVDECVEKLAMIAAGRVDVEKMRHAGYLRATRSGYDNDARLRRVILATQELSGFFAGLAKEARA